MDMSRQSRGNRHRYVLLASDTFSKFLSGVPLFDRREQTVRAALESLVNASPFPWTKIYWDKEGSFLSRHVQQFLKDRGIVNYTTKSIVKAPGVERAIRTLRTLLQRRFEAAGNVKWEKELPIMIGNYNRRVHSVTKLPPIQLARNPILIADVPQKQHRFSKPPRKKIQLPPIGSFVRLNRLRGAFEKEASWTWTEEVFRVVRHNSNQPIPLIYVEDLAGEAIVGGLYPEEYQSVAWNGKREIANVVKTRRSASGRTEYLVAYKGWPAKFNTWTHTKPRLVL